MRISAILPILVCVSFAGAEPSTQPVRPPESMTAELGGPVSLRTGVPLTLALHSSSDGARSQFTNYSFMFALLVCQKESMWTLMVYIYQLQQSYYTPIVFASLVIAAIPTLVVFVLCQNVIMKGIVVPVEK